jgi:ketosteroid isomerase-like protein
MTVEEQIVKCEEALLKAMFESDVTALDSLLSDDLVFTDHTGHLVDKSADMEAHRSGMIEMKTLEASEQIIKVYNDTAIVSVVLTMKGQFRKQDFAGQNRFTRVWMKRNDSWQIVAAHSTVVQ